MKLVPAALVAGLLASQPAPPPAPAAGETIKARLPNALTVVLRTATVKGPTTYVELSIREPASAASRQIYPPAHVSRVRQEFVDVVRQRWAALGEKWFRDHHHHGDATRFDNAMGEVVVDWSRGLAFPVTYRDAAHGVVGLDSIALAVIVTCDGLTSLASVECRETKMDDWKQRFPNAKGEALLKLAAGQPRLLPWK